MRKTLRVVLALSLACSASLTAQMGPDAGVQPLRRAIMREAGTQAAIALPAAARARQAGPGWAALHSLELGDEVSVDIAETPSRQWRFIAVTDHALILQPSGVGAKEQFDRDDVVRVSVLRTKHHHSHDFAVLGVALGLVFGVRSAAHFAYRQCDGSCMDEKIYMSLLLVGLPVAGGVLGWQLSTRPSWQLIYERGA